MSQRTNRAKLKKAEDNHTYRIIWLKFEFPRYWEEGINFHPVYRRGFKNPNKFLQHYQVREYRTWKYNRKTRWK